MFIVALFAKRVQQQGALVARSDVWAPIAARQHRDKNRPEVALVRLLIGRRKNMTILALSFVFVMTDKRPLLITAMERPHDATYHY